MRSYVVTLIPQGGFGTQLKGDTLFGHFCWQAAYDPGLLEGGLDHWIACYAERPCVVFSSAFFRLSAQFKGGGYALPRPVLPQRVLFGEGGEKTDRKTLMVQRKERQKMRWMKVGKDWSFHLGPDAYLDGAVRTFSQPHNSISRLTGTTGEPPFAPFQEDAFVYAPGVELAVLVLVDEEATDSQRLNLALERIGRWGFGRNASTGLGRFLVKAVEETTLPAPGKATACYTLAPAVPEQGFYKEQFFNPFVRFGKHGDRAATGSNPFKNPVVMADEGAVFFPGNRVVFSKPYLGRAVTGVSLSEPRAVAQGYSPYLPLTVEV